MATCVLEDARTDASPTYRRSTMSDRRTKSHPRGTVARQGRSVPPNRSVEELLLDLAYRMHATRVVRVLPLARSGAARN